jgi:hypothetical protein
MNPVLPFPDVISSALSAGLAPPAFIAMIVMKATVVLILGIVAVVIARRAAAAIRHGILAFTLAAALGLPLGMLATPAWRVAILPVSIAHPDVASAILAAPGSPALPPTESQTTSSVSASDPAASATTTISSNEQAASIVRSSLARVADLWIPLTWLLGF